MSLNGRGSWLPVGKSCAASFLACFCAWRDSTKYSCKGEDSSSVFVLQGQLLSMKRGKSLHPQFLPVQVK